MHACTCVCIVEGEGDLGSYQVFFCMLFLSRKINKLFLLVGSYIWMIEIARKEGSLVLMIREQYFCSIGRIV